MPQLRLAARIAMVEAYSRLVESLPPDDAKVVDPMRFFEIVNEVHAAADALAAAYEVAKSPWRNSRD